MGPSLLKSKDNEGGVPSIDATLRALPGFDRLSGPVLEQISALADIVEARQGEVLFREAERPEALFVLIQGHVTLTGTAVDLSGTLVDIIGPGSAFVIANALTDDPYLIGAEVVANATMIKLAAAELRDAVAAQPGAAMAMMHALASELDAMTRQVVDLKARIAAQRLGSYLLNMVSEPAAAKADFRLPVNKGLLASWLGCRAENLSRAFVGLRAYGVETHGSRVLLHDVARLRSYAGEALPEAEAAAQAEAAGRVPVEKLFGDAFRLRSKSPRGG